MDSTGVRQPLIYLSLSELVARHKDTFTPMLALYSKLHKVFSHTFDPQPVKHTNDEVDLSYFPSTLFLLRTCSSNFFIKPQLSA